MNRRLMLRCIASTALIAGMLFGVAGCGGDDSKKESETEDTTTVATTTTEATTTLTDFSGPLPSNTVEISWQETTIEQTVRYAYVSTGNYLRVRSGPGQDYDIVGTMTSDQQVIVIAVTSTGWYKTIDGFYISGDFLTETPNSSSLG